MINAARADGVRPGPPSARGNFGLGRRVPPDMKRSLSLLTLLFVAGCAGQTPDGGASAPNPTQPDPRSANLFADGYQGRFLVRATVLENEHHGPQLCRAVAESLPPQCGGPDIVGWKWSAVKYDSALHTKWGSYLITGTFDGTKFTLSEPAKSDGGTDPSSSPPSMPDFTSPCPAPAGGWKALDPANATEDAFSRATELASKEPDFGGLWIDQPVPVADPTPRNDPQRYVLNVTFTGDLARHEAALRKVWGGALCVSQVQHTEAELRKIQEEVGKAPGVISSGIDVTSGTITVEMFLARESRQRELDAKYGAGLVRLQGVLHPLD